jgi:hypothetical protein
MVWVVPMARAMFDRCEASGRGGRAGVLTQRDGFRERERERAGARDAALSPVFATMERLLAVLSEVEASGA